MKITKEELLSIIKEEMNLILNEQGTTKPSKSTLMSFIEDNIEETSKLIKTVGSMLTTIQENSKSIKNQEKQMREILDMIQMLKEMLKEK